MTESTAAQVLVVDDEERYAEAHARMLQDEYEVATANGGEAALEAISPEIDLLILDRNMPSLSGDEVAAEVSERDFDCRIVMITAVEPDFDIVDMGIDDYLTKPVDEAELKGCVRNALEWGEYNETLRDYFTLSNKREVLLEEGSAIEDTAQLSEIDERLMETAERGLQKSEETLQTLIQSSPAAIATLDAEGKIDIWNPSAEELFGWTYDDVSGEDPPMFTAEAETRMEDIRATLFSDTTVTDFDVECVTASGSLRDVSLSAAPLYDSQGEMYGLMFVMTDITERKQREQRLSVLSRVLRHNLRNELNTVLGRAQISKDLVSEDEEHHLDEIIDSVYDLLDLSQKAQEVEDVLDEHTGETEPTDSVAIVDRVLSKMQQNHPDATFEFAAEHEQMTVVASAGLSTVVRELVENAIEHNDGVPVVEVSLESETDEESDWTVIRVADDGPGIPNSEIAVLEKEQEEALTHGSGIGLWAVKWIVDRYGGELAFADSDLGGTAVTIRLPTGQT